VGRYESYRPSGDEARSRHRCPLSVPTTEGRPATNSEGLAPNQGAVVRPLRGLATNRERAGPTPQEVAARVPRGLATIPAAPAKRLRAPAMTVVWQTGPLDLEGLQAPQVRPFEQTYYKACGQAGSGKRLPAVVLSARSSCARVLARGRENFFGGVKDSLRRAGNECQGV
jgi:hypothetical protein